MKKIFFVGMILLVLIGGIFIISELVGSDNFENEAVKVIDDISYGVQYTTENSSEILFKGFVENTSSEDLIIEHGELFTNYKVFDHEENEIKGVQKRSGDYASILNVTTLEPSKQLVEGMHTILDLPKGEYTVLVQFSIDVENRPEIVPADLEVALKVE